MSDLRIKKNSPSIVFYVYRPNAFNRQHEFSRVTDFFDMYYRKAVNAWLDSESHTISLHITDSEGCRVFDKPFVIESGFYYGYDNSNNTVFVGRCEDSREATITLTCVRCAWTKPKTVGEADLLHPENNKTEIVPVLEERTFHETKELPLSHKPSYNELENKIEHLQNMLGAIYHGHQYGNKFIIESALNGIRKELGL